MESCRPFLKWPGGKYRVVERIRAHLPAGQKLIEPFVGGAAVFLNTDYKRYCLNDANPDLINVYRCLQESGEAFIDYCAKYFSSRTNDEQQYYQFRKEFNDSTDCWQRSALFVYLNRHGYNGLIRYNQSRGEFNVPFGRYSKPYFPRQEMQFFAKKIKKAKLTCQDFTAAMLKAKTGDVVYCDPPYVPISKTANFTAYQPGRFGLQQQEQLAELALELSARGVAVVLSNHATPLTKSLYQHATITQFQVSRFISCNVHKRVKVKELLAVFE